MRACRRVTRFQKPLVLLLMVSGCAGDAITSLDSNTSGLRIETTPVVLSGTKDVALGGPDGVIFEVKGGTPGARYYWNMTGDLPPGVMATPSDGVTASRTLVLSGVPSTSGQYTMHIRLDDSSSHAVLIPRASFTITIAGDALSPPQLVTKVLFWAAGLVGYQQTLSVVGGTAPYTWSAAGLPSTLTLGAQDGVVSGTADLPGVFDVTVTTADSGGRTGVDTLRVKVITPADFSGTWSGTLTKGAFMANGAAQNLAGQRLGLVFDDQGVVTQGVVHSTRLQRNRVPTSGTDIQFNFGGHFIGQFNGPLPQVEWHVVCTPIEDQALRLDCTMHYEPHPPHNAAVILSRVSSDDQDTTPPTVSASVLLVPSRQLTLTFSEPMSSGAVVALTPSGSVNAVTFSPDGATATLSLEGIVPVTTYTLTLNPSGQTGFVDLAGNPLAETAITFAAVQ